MVAIPIFINKTISILLNIQNLLVILTNLKQKQINPIPSNSSHLGYLPQVQS